MEDRLRDISSLQFFGREVLAARFNGQDQDKIAAELVANAGLDIENLGRGVDLVQLGAFARSLLERAASDSSHAGQIALEALDDADVQQGTESNICWAVFIIAAILALRVGTVETSGDSFKVVFDSAHTKEIIELVKDLLPNPFEAGDPIEITRKRIEQIEKQ